MPEKTHRTIRLRGHHLLCVFGFRGLGYDDRHAAWMGEVVRGLQQDDTRVTIIAGLDVICEGCPRRDRESCQNGEHARDLAVLTALGLSIGHEEAAAVLFSRVAATLNSETLALVCDGCGWRGLGYCTEGIAAGRIAAGWEEGS